MITVDSFFSGTLNTVDNVIGDFVNLAYTHFVQANAEMITLLFTVYVMFLGYQFLSHHHHFNLNTVIRHILVLLCVYALVMNWKLYDLFIYKIFTTEPANIAQILVSSTGKYHADASIAKALDDIYLAVFDAAKGLFEQISFSASGIAFALYALLVLIIGSLMCVFALLLFVYAKMMMAVVLALGPIFILFVLWDSTSGMFSAWLRQLITIAMVPVVTSAILTLMLSVIHVTLPSINVPANEMQFYGMAPFLGLSLATTMILTQVFRICSALGGGLALSSLSTGGALAASAMRYSGMFALGRGAMSWSRNQMGRTRQRLNRGGQ